MLFAVSAARAQAIRNIARARRRRSPDSGTAAMSSAIAPRSKARAAAWSVSARPKRAWTVSWSR